MQLIFTATLTALLYADIPAQEVFIGAAIILVSHSLFAYVSSKNSV